MPAATCALVVPESQVGTDSIRSVAPEPVLVDVEVAGTSMEPRDGFLDLKTFFKMRFISLMIKVKEKGLSIT